VIEYGLVLMKKKPVVQMFHVMSIKGEIALSTLEKKMKLTVRLLSFILISMLKMSSNDGSLTMYQSRFIPIIFSWFLRGHSDKK